MATTFPALRGLMGDQEYFIAISTVGEATRTVQYVEEVDDWGGETPPELKLQRKLNIQRVEREMVPYLIENRDHFYGALTVEVRPAPDTEPGEAPINFEVNQTFPGNIQFGVVMLDGSESLYALDGQHRLKSLEIAIRQQPQLAREQIALILMPYRGIRNSQTLFSDLNRYARAPSKSMSLLFTHREAMARVTKRLCGAVPLLQNRVNMETTTLSRNAKQFITLSTLYEMTRTMLGRTDDGQEFDEVAALTELVSIWDVLVEAIPQWRFVVNNEEHPAYLRQQYLNMHGVCQQAIAIAVSKVRTQSPNAWERIVVDGLRELDWRLANHNWDGIALHGGRVNNTTTSIRNLAALLEAELGHEPEERSAAAIRAAFAQQGLTLPAVMSKKRKVGVGA